MHYKLPTMATEEEPTSFQSLGNGVYYYNYNIVTTSVYSYKEDDREGEYVTGYKYTQVRINGTPTVAKCVEAIYNAAKDEFGMSPTYDKDIIYQVKSDFGLVPKKSELDKYKDRLIEEITDYDKSDNVNTFYYKGEQAWLDKTTRIGLINSTTLLKNNGEENAPLWLNNKLFTLPCDEILSLLNKLELYTIKCTNVTNQHKANVLALTSIQDYDYTVDYPLKLQFN